MPDTRARLIPITLLGYLFAGSAAHATVTVRFDPPVVTTPVGSTVDVSIYADIPTPVVAWGLDLVIGDGGVASVATPPVIGPSWLAATTADGDGLAGLAFPNSITGSNILLATVSLQAISVGESDLVIQVTPGDPTEGFGLDPIGFASTSFLPGRLQVTPEPSTALICTIAGLVFFSRRSCTRPREGVGRTGERPQH